MSIPIFYRPTKDDIKNEIDRLNEIIDGLNDLSSVENSYQKIISSIEHSFAAETG
jgi:hypothetical protein